MAGDIWRNIARDHAASTARVIKTRSYRAVLGGYVFAWRRRRLRFRMAASNDNLAAILHGSAALQHALFPLLVARLCAPRARSAASSRSSAFITRSASRRGAIIFDAAAQATRRRRTGSRDEKPCRRIARMGAWTFAKASQNERFVGASSACSRQPRQRLLLL